MGEPSPLYREAFDAVDLRERHPPRFTLAHKRAILAELCRDGCQRAGRVEVSRWPTATALSGAGAVEPEVRTSPGGYAYGAAPEAAIEWYVNFAAYDLFAFYAGRCFAQDEIQVFEHPALGAVREGLIAKGLCTRVTDVEGPTPFLIRGVERRLRVDTRPRSDGSWTSGLYGRKFSQAPYEAARAGVSEVEPPSVSDILVMEAPVGGLGRYQREEIDMALRAAFTGFRAAVIDSCAAGRRCAIHTGFWGCGAYGGYPALMVSVQLIAARMAGVDRLEFYLWDSAGEQRFAMGQQIAQEVMGGVGVDDGERIVENLTARGFVWGMSDGN